MKTLSLTLLATLFALGCADKPVDDTGTASTDDLDADGYSVEQGDCDDYDATVNPGQDEVWYDGVDQNCDGNDTDQDGDGAAVTDDCDDTDAAVNADAVEVCDGVDNDCDGDIDGGATDGVQAWVDADGDGHGDPDAPATVCGDIPAGYAGVGDDCDDTQPTVYPGAAEICDDLDNNCDGTVNEGDPDEVPYYRDADGDGYGDPASSVTSCTTPEGYTADGTDCNDAISAINPGADEYCDETDRDCDGNATNDPVDGTPYYTDADADGYGDPTTAVASCEAVPGLVSDGTDCDDAAAAVNPGAAEVCDGLDNDCSGAADDGLAFADWYADADADGFGDPSVSTSACDQPVGYVADATDCDDTDALTYAGATEVCDLKDNDCNGVVDDGATDERSYYADGDADGYGDAAVSVSACGLPAGYAETADDCDDTDATVYPGAFETCNGVDDDCDGTADDAAIDAGTWYADADGDSFGDAGSAQAACSQPAGYVADGTDCDDTSSANNPSGTETCDGADNNCDGTIDEDTALDARTWYADADGDGYGDATSTRTACDAPSGYVADATDCNDLARTMNPGATETCNGVDDDCDGQTDEAGASDETTWYVDDDGDGHGATSPSSVSCDAPVGYVAASDDCDDADAGNYPGNTEADDGADNDCDGWVDEDFVSVGDIVISEVARQPWVDTTTTDTAAEWFEVYNASTRDIDMSNWYIARVYPATSQAAFYVDPADDVVIGAGTYAVFCKTDDFTSASTSASTLVCDYYWGDETQSASYAGTYHANTFYFGRDQDDLSIYLGGDATTGTLIDNIHWSYNATGGFWPRDARHSMGLDPAHLDSVSNDDEANWCSPASTSTYVWYDGATYDEYGTPGTANYDCP